MLENVDKNVGDTIFNRLLDAHCVVTGPVEQLQTFLKNLIQLEIFLLQQLFP